MEEVGAQLHNVSDEKERPEEEVEEAVALLKVHVLNDETACVVAVEEVGFLLEVAVVVGGCKQKM